jgi:hypothetical protein
LRCDLLGGLHQRSSSLPHPSACSCSNKNFLQEHAEVDHWRDFQAEHGLMGSGLNVDLEDVLPSDLRPLSGGALPPGAPAKGTRKTKPKNSPPGLPWQQAFTPLWPARPAVTPYLSRSRLASPCSALSKERERPSPRTAHTAFLGSKLSPHFGRRTRRSRPTRSHPK